MTRRLVVSYLIVTALALALLAIPLGITFAHHERDRFLSEMEADADTMASLVAYPIDAGRSLPARDINAYALRTHGHVIVVDRNGIALVDTQHPKPGLDYSTRPEIQQALLGRRVEGLRHSDTAETTLLYAAVPTNAKGQVNGAVRITYPTAALDTRVRRVWVALVLLCLSVLAVAALVGLVLARSIVRPVRRLEEATDRVASGDVSARLDESAGTPEFRHLAATFNRMAGRLTNLLDAQRRFVADASHQLRTPLTALRLRIENLDAHVAEPDRAAVGAAAAEVSRMSRLVDGLLLLARDEGDATPSAPVDVAAVVRDRAEMWSDVAAERDVTLTLDVPAVAWARAVPGGVEQLVDNLVDNALVASPAGTQIVLQIVPMPTAVEVHVLDRGRGLDAGARIHAFDRFWRAPDAAAGGSGIGLAIVRQLAEASGGSARLDPRPGTGIDAVVVLPATTKPRARDARPDAAFTRP